jgi:sigma-B regulation protein RsbU (phosphoserine phosphatase)
MTTDSGAGTRAHGSEIQYRLLLEMSQQISRTFDLQETLDHLLDSLRSVLDYDAAGIFVLNRNVPSDARRGANLIAGMATVGFELDPEHGDPMLRSGKGIVGHVIRTGETVVAPDVMRNEWYIQGRAATRSEIAVPIVSNNEVIGALNLESDRLGAFSTADAELLGAFAVAAAISIEKAVLHRQVVEKHLLEHQLKIARQVQASLLPAEAPRIEGYDIDGLNVPAWDIGGDYFDYFPLGRDRLGLAIADVSGKGVPAALLMATFRASLRSEVRKNRPMPAIIQELHDTLAESMDTSHFVSAVYGVLDTQAGTFSYINCGHDAPILLHARGDHELLHATRPALGMFGGAAIEPSIVGLDRGDTLLMYTDGVIELTDANLTSFGQPRLERVLADAADRRAADIIASLVAATRAFSGRDRYDDDFTLLVVKRR